MKHNDITGDPAGVSGADYIIDPIESLTDSSLKYQTSKFSVSVPNFTNGSTTTPTVPTIDSDVAGRFRLNLLKEHYNDLVTQCRRVTRIRTLSFDQIKFGSTRLSFSPGNIIPSDSWVGPTSDNDVYVSVVDSYLGWDNGSTPQLTGIWSSLGATISNIDDVPDYADDLAYVPEITTTNAQGLTATTPSYYDASVEQKLNAARYVTLDEAASVAASHGFKFRAIGWFMSLSFQYSEEPNSVSTFTQSGAGAYKATFRLQQQVGPSAGLNFFYGPPPTATGSDLVGGPDDFKTAGASHVEFYWKTPTGLTDITTPGVQNICFVLYDTSIDDDEIAGKLTRELVETDSGLVDNGDATVSDYYQGIHYLGPTYTNMRDRFCFELTPTAHDATPEQVTAAEQTAESNENDTTQPGYSRLIQ